MIDPIGARFMAYKTLTLEKLNCHHFSTLGQPRATFDYLRLDLELWLNNHSFEELPDAIEYYLDNPNSDLQAMLPT